MKKSLSRVLSLALVLVMVLGIMPMAMAATADDVTVSVTDSEIAKGETTTVTVTLPSGYELDGELSWTGNPGQKSGLTATYTGIDLGTHNLSVSGSMKNANEETVSFSKSFTITVVSAIETGTIEINGTDKLLLTGDAVSTTLSVGSVVLPTGYTLSKVNWSVEPTAGASVTGDKQGAAFNATAAGDYTVTATATFGNGTEGQEKTAMATLTIKVTEAVYSVAISKDAVTLIEAESTTLDVTVKNGTTVLPSSDYKVAWKSTDSTKAAVDAESGKVTGVAEGTATVTATVTIGEEEQTVSCKVTVTAGAIKCDNHSELSDSSNVYQLNPVYGDVTPADVYFTYALSDTKASSPYASVDARTGKVSCNGAGLVSVTITAKNKDGDVLATKDVLVSFYEKQNVEVTMNEGVTTFSFDSKTALKNSKVLSSLILANLGDTPDGWADVGMMVELTTLGSKLDGATLTLPEGTGASTLKKTVPARYLGDVVLKVNSNSKATFSFGYTFVYNGVTYGTGTVTINLTEGAGDIIYKTTPEKAVTFDEEDFEDFYAQFYTTDLSYVMFTVNSVNPLYGDLYTTNLAATAVKSTMMFKPGLTSTTSTYYDLDKVTYVPEKNLTSSYEVEISFTCYGGTSNQNTVSGVVVIEVTGNEMPFTDVDEDDWYYDDVAYVYNNGIMNGTSTYIFSPNATLTRGMVVTMLYRIEGEPTVYTSSSFKDLTQSWYKDAVAWAAANDIVNGYSSTTFGPENAITREQLATILYRYADYKNDSTYSNASLTKFSDYQSVSSYAKDAMEWAVYNGIITGSDGKLVPGGSATRAQAAAMFHRYLED